MLLEKNNSPKLCNENSRTVNPTIRSDIESGRGVIWYVNIHPLVHSYIMLCTDPLLVVHLFKSSGFNCIRWKSYLQTTQLLIYEMLMINTTCYGFNVECQSVVIRRNFILSAGCQNLFCKTLCGLSPELLIQMYVCRTSHIILEQS